MEDWNRCLQGLQADTKQKTQAAENILGKLKSRAAFHNVPGDIKLRVMTTCVELLKEVNPKVVDIGFFCVEKLLELQRESFQPLLNMTFDSLITKYTDSKVTRLK